MNESAIIIGGGLGGLFTGALLAKENYSVTVIEKNHTIGGGLQTFVRDGEEFETGMHILGGLRPGGSVHKICHYLGILDRLQMLDTDDDCMDSIYYMSDKKEYRIASGREGMIRSLSTYFPHESDNIRRYIQALYDIADKVDFFYLRTNGSQTLDYPPQFLQPVNRFIASFVEDERLRDLLGYMNPMYGGVKDHTPTYVHSLISVLYINGPRRFIGGSMQLANALRDIIESHNGRIITRQPVTHVEVQDRNVLWVETKDGTRYIAQHYISSIHPCSLLDLMNKDAVPRSYRNRLNDIPNSYSAFTVYMTLHDGVMPYINHTCYCQDDYNHIWEFGTTDDSVWPHGFMYMTPPVEHQGKYARKLIITAPMSFDLVRPWADTAIGQRGADYEEWKREHAERLILSLIQLHPCLEGNIRNTYAASPLTIRDYYNVKDGSMYGFSKDCHNIILSQVPIYTKVRNLLLTGQNINLHGICGVPLTAINTAEALLGIDYLINKINNDYQDILS